ncbi:hypothetical protein HAX54_036195 [Datura stramonium]|uniref:Uncharacterized protein n=1 Tax=Datura stramonium TaxID=4076 RepID=A0ABS8SG80_DATST|nr:hypothetical protein [Datura stramonium]
MSTIQKLVASGCGDGLRSCPQLGVGAGGEQEGGDRGDRGTKGEPAAHCDQKEWIFIATVAASTISTEHWGKVSFKRIIYNPGSISRELIHPVSLVRLISLVKAQYLLDYTYSCFIVTVHYF